MAYTPLTDAEFSVLTGLDDWRVLLGGSIHATFAADSYPRAAALLLAITEAAERADHHPNLDLRYPGRVHVVLTTHSLGGLTDRDAEMAREISALAATHHATAATAGAQELALALDTVNADLIRPFWAAVLDYRDVAGDLVDPRGEGPFLWFQEMDPARTERSRFHLDIGIPHDQAEARLAAALAAGGRLVTDDFATSWWVLADAEGNEACLCTWQGRD